MVETTYNSAHEMINKLQKLEGKTKPNFCQNINNYYDEMNFKNFRFGEDPFAKHARGITKKYREVLRLLKLLHTKPQVIKKNINYYGL